MTRVSSFDRLRNLPAIFRGADLTIRCQWSSKTASQYLYRWKQNGLVDALGGHSDVYANLLATRAPNWELALRIAMPSAVIVGIDALRRAGWTTQIPTRTQVAVNAALPVYKTDRFDVLLRSPKWFELVRDAIHRPAGDALPILHPAWALADLLREADWGEFGLWPDDLELSALTKQDQVAWRRACKAFGLNELLLPIT